jgi:hypothetical protein
MRIPKSKAAWKRLQPNSIKDALRCNKEYARQFKRLTVPAIAELMAITEDTLYKWLSTGGMPVQMIPMYENVCGIDYVTRYMVYRSHKLMIDIPTGKAAGEVSVAELQQISAEAMTLLIRFYRDGEAPEMVAAALTQLMADVAYHRENVLTQPGLEFDGEDE